MSSALDLDLSADPTGRFAAQRRRRTVELYTSAPVGSTVGLAETARLAAAAVDFPVVEINILDDEFEYQLASWGHALPDPAEPPGHRPVLPRRVTMCQFTVGTRAPLAVGDLLGSDARYAALPGVKAGLARSYLGVPVRSRESDVIGTLCVFDRAPRRITADQVRSLVRFARVVEDQLDLMRRTRESHTLSGAGAATLSRAIADGEIVPWYQPVVDLESGRTRSYEALARWVHASGEVEDPSRFVPLAEDSHLVLELDLAVARRAVTDLARWRAQGRDVGVNVNLSPLHLELDGAVDAICDIVTAAGVDPAAVTLELTESRRLVDLERAARAVGDLRSFGFPVVLDDFGTGCSSLDWLMALPITGLKMDRAVTSALDSRVGRAVTRAATGLAQDLDLSLILEGISTASHVASATAHGYRFGQGHFWSPPTPAATVDAYSDGL